MFALGSLFCGAVRREEAERSTADKARKNGSAMAVFGFVFLPGAELMHFPIEPRDPPDVIANGAAFFAERCKSGKPVGGALNDRALVALQAHLERLGTELHGDAFVFHNRSGAPYSSDTLGDDFRAVRIAVFGEHDKRTLADFRRSGAHEAIAGEATPAALAHAMGNTLSVSNALFATYCRVNLTTIRSVMEARRRGRANE
jgi:hypothetical protein